MSLRNLFDVYYLEEEACTRSPVNAEKQAKALHHYSDLKSRLIFIFREAQHIDECAQCLYSPFL